MTMTRLRFLSLMAHLLLLIVIALLILTGYGITDYHQVESLTFGALSKPLSFQLHNLLVIPLLILIGLHILLAFLNRRAMQK